MYGIDDGSKNIETSLEILKDAYNNGVTDIFLTPHYVEDSRYDTNNKVKEEILNTLKNKLKEENININLYIGNEIFINENIL
jgi:protein-tyrosine phosphatase